MRASQRRIVLSQPPEAITGEPAITPNATEETHSLCPLKGLPIETRGGSRRGGWLESGLAVVSGLFNPNDSGFVGALERRPRHDEGYHEGGGCGRRSFAFG